MKRQIRAGEQNGLPAGNRSKLIGARALAVHVRNGNQAVGPPGLVGDDPDALTDEVLDIPALLVVPVEHQKAIRLPEAGDQNVVTAWP